MPQTALFPGSFDPITLGHVHLIERGLKLFPRIIIGLGTNTSKNALFSLEQRSQMIREVFKGHKGIEIAQIAGLTVSWCKKHEVRYLLRGIRSVTDLEYEKAIADMNHDMAPEVESIFLMAHPKVGHIQARIVREIHLTGGDISPFVPRAVLDFIRKNHKS